MLFVIDKLKFQRAISIVRDDRTKRTQGPAGPFMRLEANDEHVRIDGVKASAKIPATVYEPGVLFLKVTVVRRLLGTITGDKFLTIQVMADGLIMDKARLPFESNDMLLYLNPEQAPLQHPSDSTTDSESQPEPKDRQLKLWDETDIEQTGNGAKRP